MQYLMVYSAGKVWDQREEWNPDLAVNIVHWLKILNTTKIYFKKEKKQHTHTHTLTPSLFPHLSPAGGCKRAC